MSVNVVNAVKSGRLAEAPIGNNRRLEKRGRLLIGTVHGYEVAIYDEKNSSITLRRHGLKYAMVRVAMKEFLSTFGYPATVSFAKGGFVVQSGGKTFTTDTEELSMSFKLNRSCQAIDPQLWARFLQHQKDVGKTPSGDPAGWTTMQVKAWMGLFEKKQVQAA